MMYFENLRNAKKYFDYMQQKLNDENIFFVGGVVRDLFLGVVKDPVDIDITMAGLPNDIDAKIDKTNISYFKTEKFGTMTIIPKGEKRREVEEENLSPLLSEQSDLSFLCYEITPFRLESGYTDNRHPDEIQRTNDLVADSMRRDFTINAMYLSFVQGDFVIDGEPQKFNSSKLIEKPTDFVVPAQQVIYLQDHEMIAKLFPAGKIDTKKVFDYAKELAVFDIPYLPNPNPSLQGKGVFKTEKLPIGERLGGLNLESRGSRAIVIDPQHGLLNMFDRRLKAVGNPDHRFAEDSLRILRALRMVNILNQKVSPGFDFDTQTRRSIKKNYYRVGTVAKERIKDELTKVFKANNPFGYVALLDEINVLQYIFPSLTRTKNINQPVRYHPFDVYAHTMLVLYHAQKLSTNYLVKLSCVFHDVGKTDQYYFYSIGLNEEERKSAHSLRVNHVICGVEFADQDLTALTFSKKEKDEILWYVKNHMVPGEMLNAGESSQKKRLKKMLSEVEKERIDNLLLITKADRLGQFNPIQDPNLNDVDELAGLLQEIFDREGRFTPKNLAINGNDMMEFFQINPGPLVKKLLSDAFDRVLQDVPNRNEKEKILNYLKTKK